MRKVLIYALLLLLTTGFTSCNKKSDNKNIDYIDIKGVVQRKYKSEKRIDVLDNNKKEWSVYFSFDTPVTLKNGTIEYFDSIEDGTFLYITGEQTNEFTLHAINARYDQNPISPTTFVYNLYFPNSSYNSMDNDCKNVYEVVREMKGSISLTGIPKYMIVLTDLLQGPTSEEKIKGFSTSLPNTIEINEINYNKKDASLWIDFTELPLSGSCNVINAREQIVNTFSQFQEVETVHILLKGNESEALQP